ncbi:bifunctional folate synthesis protein [bacterium BMS3Bbin06]|nr:bifunctional folate synthesis protein [bacterium BMS3Abin08]GBE35669.1 bifunctional folate synthesis protein [bacterium BMS3Bbin06]HDO34715.1 2-amino-4-hydroxy-6-hydroxymethyldihydropteridine diphosphokinase [Nitrospirota bacterium]HDY70969.1 2-amino-4-hydroxy-6-hydroxymethyldihydropteridine diphosphokinase [Nitrospirota bacterium]
MAIVYIGIGTNLGNREKNCWKALERLEEIGVRVTKRSSLYETDPWGVKDQPPFINMAVETETAFLPEDLLVKLKAIETTMGREKTYRWGPRVIDLDILFYDDMVVDTGSLRIPHPRLHERAFVLEPLSEIASEFIHPVMGRSIKELLGEVKSSSPTKSRNLPM